ncbi:MAG: Unknown protein [uncultured Aureispira sp.]|uniref:Potassium channel domain-containing protein n=1 Tax=uncultured Aureispira sp. TaxID=1331704 RepID=A0A6S6T607_9BACT|nr:MAG: Unknown protein [uncultured Aureispira sp.]
MFNASKKIQIRINNDFLWLLIALSLFVFIPSFIPSGGVKDVTIYFTLLFVLSCSLISIGLSKAHLWTGLTLAMLVLITTIFPFSDSNMPAFLVQIGSLIFFFSYVTLIVLRRIAFAKRVSLNILYGSIAGYLLMGLLGGFWCRLIEHLYPGSFLMPLNWKAEIDTLTYYSFVTMSSLGYGDIGPGTAPGRATSIFIAIAGQMYLTINIALLVGSYTRNRQEA